MDLSKGDGNEVIVLVLIVSGLKLKQGGQQYLNVLECTGVYLNSFCTGKCTWKVIYFKDVLENVLEYVILLFKEHKSELFKLLAFICVLLESHDHYYSPKDRSL